MAHGFPPIDEIELRWTLRDIHARRFKLMRLSDEAMQNLVDQGLVETIAGEPRLTEAGQQKINPR